MLSALPKQFYLQPTLELAKSLVGKKLVHHLNDELIYEGFIVETEAYMGAEDRAAHSFNNRRTKRTEVMFHEPGKIYTYSMHTHTLLNIVCAPVGVPHAILIRAVEPLASTIPLIRKNRPKAKNDVQLTNGPGKLCQAFDISMAYNGQSICNSSLFITEGKTNVEIVASKRIGIDNAGEAKDYLWRFYEAGNIFVSKRD